MCICPAKFKQGRAWRIEFLLTSPYHWWLGRDFEHRTAAIGTTARGSIENARRAEGQACDGVVCVITSAEAIEQRLGPAASRRGSQLERHTGLTVGAAIKSSAVEITGRVKDQAGLGREPVRVVKAVHSLGPVPASCWRQLKHRAAAYGAERTRARTTLVGRAIEISGGVDDQPAEKTSSIRAATREAMEN